MNLSALFKPRSLAVIGASARGGPGTKILSTLRAGGFAGEIIPVSRTAAEIEGFRCTAALDDIPVVPDCVMVAVPAEAVLDIVQQAAHIGVQAMLVVSEGFADAGTEEGRQRQAQLALLAEQAGMAIAGPNSIGIASLGHSMVATITDVVPQESLKGTISLVSQSGGLMLAVAELCANRGIGLDKLVSIGNQAVIEIADYLDYLADDLETKVIGLIIEGVRNGRRFRAALARATRKKPVVVLKLGRSALGQAATIAHTGTLAGKDQAFVTLFRQSGAALVTTIDDLVETCALFDQARVPKGAGICMLTISGGATSLISDNGALAGVTFPPLALATDTKLREIIGVDRAFGNPVDTVGLPRLLNGDTLACCVAALDADPSVDLIGLVIPMRLAGSPVQDRLMDDLCAASSSASKPVVAISFMSNSLNNHWRGYAQRHNLPLMEDVGAAMRALKSLVDYGALLRKEPADLNSIRLSISTHLTPGRSLTEAESKHILTHADLPVTREFFARDSVEAATKAADLGSLVAIKVQSEDIPHKSDVGGVALRVPAQDVEAATEKVLANAAAARPDAKIDGVLVQEMVEGGAEFILGMTYDEQFGPMIVLGAGGIQVELFQDSTVRLPPVTRDDVLEMLNELKISKMLDGFRGAPPLDKESLIDCCLKFSDFVVATDGHYAAIDINPLIVLPRGKGVKIADAMIVTNGSAAALS
ncbi:MAG TPA: acetate--CoA ligase family protein [Beijerinckiaceae bacterium]|nr:acetate--CoA ligase family protein [Beijerinckiaceae bacterium]